MADKEPFGYQKPSLNDQELTSKLDRVDELVSVLLDDELSEQNLQELEGLLSDSHEARSQYVGMIQLHSDLVAYYNPESTLDTTSPILTNLTGSIDVTPPSNELKSD